MAQNIQLDALIFIGNNFSEVQTNYPKTVQFKSFEDFKRSFDLHKINNTTILIKASRGMALERILDLW
jgi:UDP-N-acetylmuramoyl-tripeptide--D-alanyl-D-alanine ligase